MYDHQEKPVAAVENARSSRTRRSPAARYLTALLLLVLPGCGDGSESYRLAAVGPWHLADVRASREAILMAVDEVNRAGGIRGKPLEMVFLNDSTSGVRAQAIAHELVGDERVLAVVGHFNSGAMIAAAKVYHEEMVSLSPTAASPELAGISPWVFRLLANDSGFTPFLARKAAMLAQRAAVLYDNNSYGRGGADAFRRHYPGKLVAVDPISPGTSRIEPHIRFLRERGVELIYVAGITASATAVLREARRQGYRGAVMGTDSWAPIVADTALSEGVYIGMRFTITDPRPDVVRFNQNFRARFGRAPDGFAAFNYDAVHLLARALEARGASRSGVRDYLASLDRNTAFRGVTGAIRFGPNGGPVARNFVMMQVRRGALVPIDVERDEG